MLMLIALALAVTPTADADTTVQVQANSRLEINRVEGNITIKTWNRSAVQVRAADRGAQLQVEVSGRQVSVDADDEDRGPYDGDLELTVPADMAVSINTQSGDVTISGLKGDLDVETVEGNIDVQGGTGVVTLQTTDGEIHVSGASGRLELNSVDGEITGHDLDGEIKAESVDGSVTLDNVTASSIDASSVDGSVAVSGMLKPGGRYRLSSHDGGVTLSVPALDATVNVSTFSGSFDSDFPVTLTSTHGGKRMNFTVGNGASSIDLESFDGAIRIERRSGTRH
jgi:DUF4097 and DUF4098 domain-containing protein YvlB